MVNCTSSFFWMALSVDLHRLSVEVGPEQTHTGYGVPSAPELQHLPPRDRLQLPLALADLCRLHGGFHGFLRDPVGLHDIGYFSFRLDGLHAEDHVICRYELGAGRRGPQVLKEEVGEDIPPAHPDPARGRPADGRNQGSKAFPAHLGDPLGRRALDEEGIDAYVHAAREPGCKLE